MLRNEVVKQQESPVTFTGNYAVQRYNAACKALACQGYIRYAHVTDATGTMSAWSHPSKPWVELQIAVEPKPLVTGFARMD